MRTQKQPRYSRKQKTFYNNLPLKMKILVKHEIRQAEHSFIMKSYVNAIIKHGKKKKSNLGIAESILKENEPVW